MSGNTWSEGTEFSQEDANALMINYRESTLKNHDEDFYKVVDEAMKEPSRKLSNCSTLLKEKITSVCVKINEERRWVINVYLNTGISVHYYAAAAETSSKSANSNEEQNHSKPYSLQ